MSTTCGKISKEQLFDCLNPLQAGSEDTMLLMNRDDIASTTRNGINNEIVEAIIMNSGALAFKYEGQDSSNAAKANVVKVSVFRKWNHEINFMAFGVDADTKEQMQKMKDGDIVAVIYNKHKGENGDSAFEMYGLDSGLKVEAMESDKTSADSQGAFVIQLKSNEETGLEPFPPKTVFITDYATTLAMLDGIQ